MTQMNFRIRTFIPALFAAIILIAGCESSSDPTETPDQTDTTENRDTGTIDSSDTLDPMDTASMVTYELTIYNDWSPETHPANFPSDAHFSWLGGGTHDGRVSFWKPGETTSPGMKEMAETGVVEILVEEEVEAAIQAGTAKTKIFEKMYTPEKPAIAPGQRTTSFEIYRSHPQLTLATMLGASPDWFVGVHGLELWRDGTWVKELTVELPLYDGGSKKGVVPIMGGPDEDPQQPIHLITYNDLQGIYIPTSEPHIVGRFVFRRME